MQPFTLVIRIVLLFEGGRQYAMFFEVHRTRKWRQSGRPGVSPVTCRGESAVSRWIKPPEPHFLLNFLTETECFLILEECGSYPNIIKGPSYSLKEAAKPNIHHSLITRIKK
jgi:hypothetical protein